MKSPVCEMLGIDFPLLAFSHCRDVVAAVSRAGGFGVLGATVHSSTSLEQELNWIDRHCDGKPYGIDVLIPENISTAGEKNVTWKSLEARVTPAHRAFTRDLLKKYGIDLEATEVDPHQPQPFDGETALQLLDVSFNHPIRLIANALGVPPRAMIEMGKKHNVPVAALVGAKEHAIRQVAAGVDLLVVQGTEAGGHCGEVSTLVLVPEVIKAIKTDAARWPVLAAGGIMTGAQMAACMAMGAAGAVDRIGLARDDGIRDLRHLPREDDRRLVARCDPLERPHRQTGAATALGLDRCVGRRDLAGRAADAAAKHHQPRCLRVDRQVGGVRQRRRARSCELFRRPGRRIGRQREIGGCRGAGIQGGFRRRDRAHERAGGDVMRFMLSESASSEGSAPLLPVPTGRRLG